MEAVLLLTAKSIQAFATAKLVVRLLNLTVLYVNGNHLLPVVLSTRRTENTARIFIAQRYGFRLPTELVAAS